MTDPLTAPAMILALVLAEVAVGSAGVLWASRLWGVARRGFFKLAGAVIALTALFAWLAARAPLSEAAGPAARAAFWLMAATAALAWLWQALLWIEGGAASRIAGLAVVPAGVAALAALALLPGTRAPAALAAFQLLGGAIFVGAVTIGLLLGHWYLVDRHLPKGLLGRVNAVFLAGCALAAAGAAAAGAGGDVLRPDLNPLLAVGGLTVALALGMMALCAIMGMMIRALVREGSLQAATGFFYLAVIMGLAGEFAAKILFF